MNDKIVSIRADKGIYKAICELINYRKQRLSTYPIRTNELSEELNDMFQTFFLSCGEDIAKTIGKIVITKTGEYEVMREIQLNNVTLMKNNEKVDFDAYSFLKDKALSSALPLSTLATYIICWYILGVYYGDSSEDERRSAFPNGLTFDFDI